MFTPHSPQQRFGTTGCLVIGCFDGWDRVVSLARLVNTLRCRKWQPATALVEGVGTHLHGRQALPAQRLRPRVLQQVRARSCGVVAVARWPGSASIRCRKGVVCPSAAGRCSIAGGGFEVVRVWPLVPVHRSSQLLAWILAQKPAAAASGQGASGPFSTSMIAGWGCAARSTPIHAATGTGPPKALGQKSAAAIDLAAGQADEQGCQGCPPRIGS